MAYTVYNFKAKKQLKEAFKEWKDNQAAYEHLPDEHRASAVQNNFVAAPLLLQRRLKVYQPGPFGPDVKDGRTAIEGPHFPQMHTWYADVEVRAGHIVKIYG